MVSALLGTSWWSWPQKIHSNVLVLVHKGDKNWSDVELFLNDLTYESQIGILVNSIFVIVLSFDVKRHRRSSPLKIRWVKTGHFYR
jgi:hypothetical protein